MYIQPASFKDEESTPTQESASRHRQLNFELCRAVDLTKLGIVLDRMVKEAGLHPEVAKAYDLQASAFLALLCSENNRLHGR